MPHSLFLGSALATQDRLSVSPSKTNSSDHVLPSDLAAPSRPPLLRRTADFFRSVVKVTFKDQFAIKEGISEPKSHAERSNNPLAFVRAHLWHGIIDMAISLLGFAVIINALILILASAVFYYGMDAAERTGPANLFDAHTLIGNIVGKRELCRASDPILKSHVECSCCSVVRAGSTSGGAELLDNRNCSRPKCLRRIFAMEGFCMSPFLLPLPPLIV